MSRFLPTTIVVALALETLALEALLIRDGNHDTVSRQSRRDNEQLVKVLMLTDLALWTEARYTRHPSQADLFTAFQNGPAALDHFPAGIWVTPVRYCHVVGTTYTRNK